MFTVGRTLEIQGSDTGGGLGRGGALGAGVRAIGRVGKGCVQLGLWALQVIWEQTVSFHTDRCGVLLSSHRSGTCQNWLNRHPRRAFPQVPDHPNRQKPHKRLPWASLHRTNTKYPVAPATYAADHHGGRDHRWLVGLNRIPTLLRDSSQSGQTELALRPLMENRQACVL